MNSVVRCTHPSCDFSKEADSQVHAHAIGRKHWHTKGHAVWVDTGGNK